MVDDAENDAGKKTKLQRKRSAIFVPLEETPILLYGTVLPDKTSLEVRVHPDRSLCRVSMEYADSFYGEVIEELTIHTGIGKPEFKQFFLTSESSQRYNMKLCHYLPQVIKHALQGKKERYLRELFWQYHKMSVN